MVDDARTVLYYTFGNHMHWADMEWLWGADVLPGCVDDMVRFCQATGAKGNVNFDGVGFEKLAAESPETISTLRKALVTGDVEVVGGSYGQPYGLFHGAESNIRQFVYGIRSSIRILGARPRTFWEEEFDFFPQLPQILAGVGIQYASLFFQWTWHTPEVPTEDVPVVWWESPDGSRVLCATRNRLNVHQWPEDVALVLDDLRANPRADALLLQWLELMPSKDWMCRSEVLLPKTLELLNDPRFEFRFATLGGYLGQVAAEGLPVRRYSMDEVFHGMSLGKNGDAFRAYSAEAESRLLTAESLAAVNGLFGRPYAQWDVYPTWELEESWRELLQAQHHDNDECEGLCGHVGKFSYDRSLSLSGHVLNANLATLAKRVEANPGDVVVFNPLGWSRDAVVEHPETGAMLHALNVPAMGYRVCVSRVGKASDPVWTIGAQGATGACGDVVVTVSPDGRISQITSDIWPEGVLSAYVPILDFAAVEGGVTVNYEYESMEIDNSTRSLVIRFRHPSRGGIRVDLHLDAGCHGLRVEISGGSIQRPDPGMHSGVSMPIALNSERTRVLTDQPLGIQEVAATGIYRKKYPTGDWMTSPQWFEDVRGSFTGLSLIDLVTADGERGLLVVQDRTRQWFRYGDTMRSLLTMYDPWDEDYFVDRFHHQYVFVPHGQISNHERLKRAREFALPCLAATVSGTGDLPSEFSALSVSAPNVIVTAFYREMESASRDLPEYGGTGMAYPYLLRLLETDGIETSVEITFAPTVASAVRTNLLGEREGEATVSDHSVQLTVAPYQVATLVIDLVEGRKQVRDLDASRNVWATVHR